MSSTEDNKLKLFNDSRDLKVQEIRGEYLYNNLFLGTISLDTIGELDRYCLNLHVNKLAKQQEQELENKLRGLCDNEKQINILREICKLNLDEVAVNNWKYLLNTVSYLDFIDYNMEIIDSLKDLPSERFNIIDNLNKRFIKTRNKQNTEYIRFNKEYKEVLDNFNRTATKTEQIIRMGYYYAVILKEEPYATMVNIYKHADLNTRNTLSSLAKRFGYEQ